MEPGIQERRLRIFIANPTRTIAKSTDHDYVNKRFMQLEKWQPVEFIRNHFWVTRLHRDLVFLIDRVKVFLLGPGKHFKNSPYSDAYFIRVPQGCDLIFSYGGFPVPLFFRRKVPVICEQTFAHGGVIAPGDWVAHIRQNRKYYVSGSSLIVTPSPESVRMFREIFPERAEIIRYAPYFLPDLTVIPEHDLTKKFESPERIKFLFVGKEARRKGLDFFVQAYHTLPRELKARMEVTVVSRFLDGKVDLPDDFCHLEYVEDIMAFFRKSHVLVFLTRQEAYGLVLVEAMAAGCTVLTTHHPIQQSIMLNQGGWFVDPVHVQEIAKAIAEILECTTADLRQKAADNRNNFIADKSPDKVSRLYLNIFTSLVHGI